jgi:hypothetical protein
LARLLFRGAAVCIFSDVLFAEFVDISEQQWVGDPELLMGQVASDEGEFTIIAFRRGLKRVVV